MARLMKVTGILLRPVVLLVVLLAWAGALPAAAAPKSNGSLCAGCGGEDEAACGTSLLPDSDLSLFCGDASKDECNICSRDVNDLDHDGSTGNFICQVKLVCAHEMDRAAQRCYPVEFGTTTPNPDYHCDGLPPQS